METSTKILLAGLATFAGFSIYSKKANGSFNPFVLLNSGPPLPSTTPQLTPGAPLSSAPPPASTSLLLGNSPEVQAAKEALKASFPNSPEVEAAVNTVQNAPPNSPEAQAAINLLSGLPASPKAKAALGLLSNASQPTFVPGTGFVPGVIDEPVVKNGDIVNVDMFTSGMALPQNIPLVGLIFMNVDSLEAGTPDKFLGSFVSPEFRVFGQQMVNRSAIKGKG